MHYKAQSAIEFLSTYLWALIIIAIVATALYFYLTLPQQSLKDFCTFSYGAYCSEFFVGNSSAGTTASFVITNSQKYLLLNPKIAVNMTNIGTNAGSCTPNNYIAPGGRMICNVTFPKAPVGSIAEGNVTLQVTVCPSGNPADCSPPENQTYIAAFGTHVIVTPKENIPLTTFIPGGSTTVTTIPTTFSTVTTSTTSTSTSTSTISSVCYPLSLTGSGTQAASPTSSGGCPSGEYTVGTSVSITATPPTGYTFVSWTGTGTGSYTGSSNPGSVTMDSAVTETANYQTTFSVVGYGGSTGSTSASYTLPGGANYYLCSGGDGNGALSSYSWTEDALSYSDYASTGHQNSATCSDSSGNADIAVGGVAVSYPGSYTVQSAAAASGVGSFSFSFSVSQSSDVIVSLGCGWFECSSVTLPAGCTQLFYYKGGDSYETTYAAECANMPVGTYTVSGTLSGAGGYAISAYEFPA